jgi:nicotinamidase-related amidase
MSKRAIIVVDLQNEYLPSGKLPLVGIEQATENAAKVIESARSEGDKVIFIRHEMAEAPFFVPGSPGVEIIPAVLPKKGEDVLVKHFPNSFRETELKRMLDAEGVEEAP